MNSLEMDQNPPVGFPTECETQNDDDDELPVCDLDVDELLIPTNLPPPSEKHQKNSSLVGPITPEKAAKLDTTALLPCEKPEKVIFKSAKKLGLTPEKWTEAAVGAVQTFSTALGIQLTARILMVRGFSSLDQAERAMEVLHKIATDEKYKPSDRAFAASMVPKAVDAMRQMSAQILGFAERSATKEAKSKPQVLPPSLGVQINVGSGSSSNAPSIAISGTPVEKPLPPA